MNVVGIQGNKIIFACKCLYIFLPLSSSIFFSLSFWNVFFGKVKASAFYTQSVSNNKQLTVRGAQSLCMQHHRSLAVSCVGICSAFSQWNVISQLWPSTGPCLSMANSLLNIIYSIGSSASPRCAPWKGRWRRFKHRAERFKQCTEKSLASWSWSYQVATYCFNWFAHEVIATICKLCKSHNCNLNACKNCLILSITSLLGQKVQKCFRTIRLPCIYMLVHPELNSFPS